MLNIVFMGTPDFAVESLKRIHEFHNIMAVVTTLDKPKGRGMKLQPTPVKEYALENNIKIYQPEKIKNNEEFIEKIKQLQPDVICVVSYGKILPKEILDIPKKGCVNVHPSLLPKYRGAAPIFWTVLNGDTTTAVTTMYMDIGMDSGDIILQKKVNVSINETSGELWNRLSVIGGELLVKTLEQIEKGTAPRIKQSDNYTLAPMLNKEMGHIDWENKTTLEIHNLIRGLNPIIGAYSFVENKKIKFWKSEIILNSELENFSTQLEKKPGTIVISNQNQGLYIRTKDGIIKILELQAENSKKMKVEDFLRGNTIERNIKLN